MAEPGGSAFLTFFQWLGGDGIQRYQRAFYQMRQLVDSDWQKLSRLSTYYLNRDWHHFDEALKQLLHTKESEEIPEWWRDHQIHYLFDVFFASVWALHPGKYFLEMKTAWNALWSSDGAHAKQLASFARAEVNTPLFVNTQRDLFQEMGRYVDLIGSLFPGLLCELLSTAHQPQVENLRLFRDDYELLRDLYIQAFESSHKVLRWVIGTININLHGDPDRFVPVAGMSVRASEHPPKHLGAFSALPSARKREWLILFPEWDKHWDLLLDRHLRNDIGHASARHELPTGLVQRDGRAPLAYTRFVQKASRLIHPLMACANALKIMRICTFMTAV